MFTVTKRVFTQAADGRTVLLYAPGMTITEDEARRLDLLPRGKAPRPKPIGKPAPEPQSKGSEVAPKGKPIERMNLAKLRAVCSAEHIDMDGLNTRSDFVAIIKLTREEAAR